MKVKLLFKSIIVVILSTTISYGCGLGGEKTDASSENEIAESEMEAPQSEIQTHALSSKEKELYNKIIEVFKESDKLTAQWTEEASEVSTSEEAIESIKSFMEIQRSQELKFSQISDSTERLELESEDEDSPLSLAIQQYMQAKTSNPEYMERISNTMKVYLGLLTKYRDNPEIQKLTEEINREED